MVRHEAEFEQLQEVLERLVEEAGAKRVLLVDKSGELVASSSEVILCSGKKGPPADRFDGRELLGTHRDVRVVAGRLILVTILPLNFRPDLAHDCVGRASDALSSIVAELDEKTRLAGVPPLFPEVTQEDIDDLAQRLEREYSHHRGR